MSGCSASSSTAPPSSRFARYWAGPSTRCAATTTPTTRSCSTPSTPGSPPGRTRAAARTLQVHPNTVYQRLDRIDLVLGHRRWREGEGAVTMQLGLQLHRLTAEIPLEELVPATGT
ncbi:helix-turn-helix domain-containing protein [Pseudonocardia benzenivorans]